MDIGMEESDSLNAEAKPGQYPVDVWFAEGASVFKVTYSGGYFRGERSVSNEFHLRVQPGYNIATEQQAEALAKKIETLLRLEDYSDKLDHNQAPGRVFTIYNGDHGQYWNPSCEGKNGNWYEDQYLSHRYADPFDALCEVLRMVRNKVIDNFEDVRIVPQDSEHFKSPINVDGKPFVVLKGLKEGNVFFTTSKLDDNPTLLDTGVVAYKVCEYVNSVEEAQAKIPQYYDW
jgi:hypothetical protein